MKYLFVFYLICMFSCDTHRSDLGETMGYVPVYASASSGNIIGAEAVRPTTHPGKIYAYGSYLFQVEQNEGIHIIDNTIPQQAHKVAFLKIPTCTELAVRSNFLYANNLNDLVVFRLNNITSPQLVNRLTGAFPGFSESYPPVSGVYFECPDPAKGRVIAWEQKMISQPKCRR